jgi:hypothetical protein
MALPCIRGGLRDAHQIRILHRRNRDRLHVRGPRGGAAPLRERLWSTEKGGEKEGDQEGVHRGMLWLAVHDVVGMP